MQKEEQLEGVMQGNNKEREMIERLQIVLEKQEVEFERERNKMNLQMQKVVEKYQEEKRCRIEVEREFENHKEILARTVRSEQQTLAHLNQLIVKSGGTPVDIPDPEFYYQEISS